VIGPRSPRGGDINEANDCLWVGSATRTGAVLAAMTGTECGEPHYCTWTATIPRNVLRRSGSAL